MSATLYGVKMRCVDLSASLLVDQLPVLTGRSRKHTLVRHSQLFTFQRSARLPTVLQQALRLASSLSFSGEGSIRNAPLAVKLLPATLFAPHSASRFFPVYCATKMSLHFVKVLRAFAPTSPPLPRFTLFVRTKFVIFRQPSHHIPLPASFSAFSGVTPSTATHISGICPTPHAARIALAASRIVAPVVITSSTNTTTRAAGGWPFHASVTRIDPATLRRRVSNVEPVCIGRCCLPRHATIGRPAARSMPRAIASGWSIPRASRRHIDVGTGTTSASCGESSSSSRHRTT